jgi:hypothetical protein
MALSMLCMQQVDDEKQRYLEIVRTVVGRRNSAKN